MRIALIHQPWNPAVPPVEAGSIAIWNYEVARRLPGRHEVTCWARNCRGVVRDTLHEGVRHRRVSVFPDPYGWFGGALLRVRMAVRPGLPPFAEPGYYAAYARRIARRLARERPDVVHVHNLAQFVPALRRILPSARILLHMHCEWLTQLPDGVVRDRVRHADAIVGCSDYIARAFASRYPAFAGQTGTLYNGVDSSSFRPDPDPRPTSAGHGPLLLYVGRISPEKGLHDLLDAFELVLRHHPEAELEIIGPDSVTPEPFLVALSADPLVRALRVHYESDYPAVLRRQARSRFGDRVRFAGAVPHRQLPEHYRRADLVVNPSLSESFGMSLIEAAACGTPAVACAAGAPARPRASGAGGNDCRRS